MNFKKNNITQRMQRTKSTSGLAYLEYCTHNGIDESEKTDIKAEFLFETFNEIKYEINKQTNEARILGSLRNNSLFPNNLIDKAINQ